MNKKLFSKYSALFVTGLLLIVAYKTLDSAGQIVEQIARLFRLILPILTAFGIAFILYPLCYRAENLLQKSNLKWLKTHSRGVSVLGIYAVFMAMVALFVIMISPVLVSSARELLSQLPDMIRSVKVYFLNNEPFGLNLKNLFRSFSVTNFVQMFKLDDVNTYIVRVADVSKALFSLFLSMIISIYILIDRSSLRLTAIRVLKLILPQNVKHITSKYSYKTLSILYKYIYCQLMDALIIFALSFIILMIMGVKYAPVLAVVLGISNLIPYFGAISASAFAAVLTVFTGSLSQGIWVAGVLIVLQQTDANVIQPRLVGEVLQVRPFWVLCGISVGGGLFGMIGILLAVPFMALIKTVFADYCDYVEYQRSVSGNQNTAKSKNL